MQNNSYDYHLDTAVRCLFIKSYGYVDKQKMIECAAACRTDPDYENNFSVLNDFTNCRFQITPSELRELAIYMANKWPTTTPIKASAIIDSQLAHGLGRMYTVYTGERVEKPILFQREQPNLAAAVRAHYQFNPTYRFPDFLNL